jgi:tetratricopeptide (TPR) repeat protein
MPLSRKRIVLFKAIGILLPFLLLILLEAGLRVFHYGHDLSLFVEDPRDDNFLVLNPDASKRYFTDPALAPTGNSEPFRKVKDPNTCRIFVLGESTTIGYPYFHNGSFHRWLQYRLMQTLPDKSFEIVNLSMTAVNSYTVLGFARELVNYEPDAVLIYSGQNEYYGALGVGSTNRISGNSFFIQLILHLRQLRITQLITSLYEKIVGAARAVKGSSSGETLMQRMVAEQQIVYGSKLYYRGIDQYSSNMDATLSLLSERHIPVFVSNIVSNEDGMRPFISIEADSGLAGSFKNEYEPGVRAFEAGAWLAADSLLRKADGIYGGHALCNYYLGQISYRLADYRGAEGFFARARDLDGLRFRAPAVLNDVIARLCSKYPYAHQVDTKGIFAAHSEHHIIGSDLILEHVHPNLKGYALMSDVFYEALKKAGIISIGKAKEMSLQQLMADMPVTTVDSLTGLYKIAKLKRSWPFNGGEAPDTVGDARVTGREDSGTVEQRLARDLAFKQIRWTDAMETLYNYYIAADSLREAATVVEGMVLEYPNEVSYCDKTANIYGKSGDLESAAFYFKRGFGLSPSSERARTLFVLYLDLDEPAAALPYLNYSIGRNTDNRLIAIKRYTEQVIQLERSLAGDASLAGTICYQIAENYYRMGNKAGALKYLGQVLKTEPGNKEALSLQARIKGS